MTRTFTRATFMAVLAATLSAQPCTAGTGGVVLEWNQIALAASVTAAQGPNPQTRTMAIVHVSIHNALNGITRRYQPYGAPPAPPFGASPDAAVIAAAHYSLKRLFPLQAGALDMARHDSLASRALSEADPGIGFGEAVAEAIVTLRATDGASRASFPYTAPGAGLPGVWVPVGTAPPLLPGWGEVAPWVLRDASQFRSGRPYRLDSDEYARDYNEVKEVGSRTSLTRTAEQSEIARFWVGTPSAIWNGVAIRMIEAHRLSDSNAAQILAHFYLAAADAGIATWRAKYSINFWRPFTAVRNGHLDGNDCTDADPLWEPFLTTPQHPEFPSGHATNSSAMATVLIRAFGDQPGVPIVATSPTNPSFPRMWKRFSDGIAEVIEARIYGGIHYRRADEAGAKLGGRIAKFVVKNTLRPKKSS